MQEEKNFKINFNRILCEEMGKVFEVKPLPLDPEFKVKYSDKEKNVFIESEYHGCARTGGLRFGEMDFGRSMLVDYGCVLPAKNYDFPIFGFDFIYASKFLIGVIDLHPISRDKEYMDKYILPLKDVCEKYKWIPKAEGGRSESHEWAKFYNSGFAFYRWCDTQYLPNLEEAFKDYINVFCDCISKAEPLTDQEILLRRDNYMERYRDDYTTKDPGSAPMKHHFGEEWGERYFREFLFAP